jgi:hypothetical protein
LLGVEQPINVNYFKKKIFFAQIKNKLIELHTLYDALTKYGIVLLNTNHFYPEAQAELFSKTLAPIYQDARRHCPNTTSLHLFLKSHMLWEVLINVVAHGKI